MKRKEEPVTRYVVPAFVRIVTTLELVVVVPDEEEAEDVEGLDGEAHEFAPIVVAPIARHAAAVKKFLTMVVLSSGP